MRRVLALLAVLFLLSGCSAYEKENRELKEEIKQMGEENNYLKAELVGLKKEVAELRAKLKEERESAARRSQEEVQAAKKTQEDQNGKKKPAETKVPPKKKLP
jgi:chromosome segregation ATPase